MPEWIPPTRRCFHAVALVAVLSLIAFLPGAAGGVWSAAEASRALLPQSTSESPRPAAVPGIVGSWEGTYFVYPEIMALTLTLRSSDGTTLTGEARFRPLVDKRRVFGQIEGAVGLRGTYSPVTRTFSLAPTEWLERPRQAGTRALNWEGVFDADRPALAGYLTDPSGFRRSSPIHFVLARPGESKWITKAMKKSEKPASGLGRLRLGPLRFGRGPDAEVIARWARRFTEEYPELDPRQTEFGRLFGPAFNLYADEHFQEHFGTTFDAMSASKRAAVADRLGKDALRPYSAFARPFASTGTQGTPEIMSGVLALRVIRSWQQTQRAHLSAMEPTPDAFDRIAAVEEAAELYLARQWPSDRKTFVESVAATRRRLAGPVLLARAEAAVAEARGYEGARLLANWPQQQRDLLRWAPETDRNAALERVDGRLDAILAPLLAAEAAELERLGRGLLAVQRGNKWYREYHRSYGFAADRPGYRTTLARLTEVRPRHLSESREAVTAYLTKLGRESEVDQVVASLLVVPGDRSTAAGRSILRVANSRKTEIAHLRRQRQTAALTGTIALIAEAYKRNAQREDDWLTAGVASFTRDQMIESAIRALLPDASQADVQSYRRVISLALDGEILSPTSWTESAARDRILRELRDRNPELTWEPAIVNLLIDLRQAYGRR